MHIVELIVKKREGKELSKAEIEFIINGYVRGGIPDYQMSALLMAICLKGMTSCETSELTMAMVDSGDIMDLSQISGIKVDKHSTGGVGDTTTLIVAPLVAACGAKVAKMSGRGLGHTGGTIDKLESIPGMKVALGADEFIRNVNEIGLAVVGQTGELVPADKLIYALRDVTGTVESIPLIASSIMSKKIAAGADAIVLDVKAGSGAFMRTPQDAKRLADEMVAIGSHTGRKTVAIITDMNQPLGMAVGNALEVREAVQALSGQLDENDPLVEVSLLLGAQMLVLAKLYPIEDEAREALLGALRSGRGLEKLRAMILAQGGDESIIDDPDKICRARSQIDVTAKATGVVRAIRAQEIGRTAQLLGAGRASKADVIDHAVGLVMKKRIGEKIEKGEPLATLYVNDEKNLNEAQSALIGAIEIGESAPQTPMVYAVVK